MQSSLNLKLSDSRVSEDGKREEGFLNIGLKPDGSWVRIPVIIIRGQEDGPTLLVDACTHGDEFEGTEAIIDVADQLLGMDFKGTLLAVPVLNLDAYAAQSRISSIDSANLNRVFPGAPDKYITQRIAYSYLNDLIAQADYGISFHGGGDVLYLEPIVGYQPVEDENKKLVREMAKVFGTEYIWRMQNLPFDGVSIIEARKRGIPMILPEVGSHCARFYDREKNVAICSDGILNVMKFLGMLNGDAPAVEKQMDTELHYIHTDTGGIHVPLKKPGVMVQKGEILAEIKDFFGHHLADIIAPFDGVVIGYWSISVINPGDWSYLFSKVLDDDF